MYTYKQIVSHAFSIIGYKKISNYILSDKCNINEVDDYINLLKFKLSRNNGNKYLREFINYFL